MVLRLENFGAHRQQRNTFDQPFARRNECPEDHQINDPCSWLTTIKVVRFQAARKIATHAAISRLPPESHPEVL
jgi:hypothetical protein